MPWWIQPNTGDHRQVQTLYTYDENDQEIAPKLLPMKTTVPGPEWRPLRFIMHSKHKIIPDIATGPRSGMMLVSSKVKAMIEKMDPVQHHYIPLEIRRKNGILVEQEFYLFKFGSFVDGVVIEQSQVYKKIDSDGELWGLGSSISAKFVWRASAIKGRHIWGDKYLINDVFCSDEFMAELEQQKIKVFNKIKSYMATEH